MNVVDAIAMAIDRARSLRLADPGILGAGQSRQVPSLSDLDLGAQIESGSSLRDVDVAHTLTGGEAFFKTLADLLVRFNPVSRALPCGSC